MDSLLVLPATEVSYHCWYDTPLHKAIEISLGKILEKEMEAERDADGKKSQYFQRKNGSRYWCNKGKQIVVSTVYLNKDGIYKAKELEIDEGDESEDLGNAVLPIDLIFNRRYRKKEDGSPPHVHILDKTLKDIGFMIGDYLEICILEKGKNDLDIKEDWSMNEDEEEEKDYLRREGEKRRGNWNDRGQNREAGRNRQGRGRGEYGDRRGGGNRERDSNYQNSNRDRDYNRRNEGYNRDERGNYGPRDNNKRKNGYGDRRNGR